MSVEEPAADFREIVEGCRTVRKFCWLFVILLTIFLGARKGPFWGLGVLVAGALLEINLSLMLTTLKKAKPGPLTVPLWVSVVKFNLIIIADMIVCFLVVKFHLGEPLAFLLGLLMFPPALLAGLVRYSKIREKAASPPLKSGQESPDAPAKDDFGPDGAAPDGSAKA